MDNLTEEKVNEIFNQSFAESPRRKRDIFNKSWNLLDDIIDIIRRLVDVIGIGNYTSCKSCSGNPINLTSRGSLNK